ncbi:MAG: LysR family transcriptional regulator [Pseudomonadota bacterium]
MDLKQTELGLLLALDALLEAEAVTPAARRLGISQPAMSAQLARLRALFNDPLLVPSGRRLVATTRALELKDPLRRLLAELDALVSESARFEPETTQTTFRLIGTDYVHTVLGPVLMDSIAKNAPQARLALLAFDPPAVWPALEEGRVDAALVTGVAPPDARIRTALSEDFMAVQRRGHPRGAGSLTLESFCAADHVLISPEGGGFVGAADHVLSEKGMSRRVACSLPSFLIAPAIIAASDLIGLLPRRLAERQRGQIDAFEMPFPSPRFTIDLIWHPRRQNDPAHRWFRDAILTAAASL